MIRWWQQLKNVYHLLQAHAWRLWSGWPDTRLTIYGITGTDGKTTASFVLAAILREASGADRVGLLSTELLSLGRENIHNETKFTTLPSRLLFRYLRRMVDAGVTQAVLEMTSHGLDQHRFAGLQLGGAIILNITPEHLDYHQTMAAYARAKARIIDYLRAGSPLVVQEDAMRKLQISQRRFRALRLIRFAPEQVQSVVTPLPGDFNKENVLAAQLLARAVGVDRAAVRRGVSAVRQVPGRTEWVESAAGVRVLIDFALTPAALTRLYRYVQQEVTGNIIAVFGATGNRDRRKRPRMTRVAAAYAHEIVLTRDEPYTEPEERIYRELESGLAGVAVAWRRIPDRRAAIRYALSRARPDDVVVITGMGSFTSMAVGKRRVPWSDKKVVLELLAELEKSEKRKSKIEK
jgi:UDP-N-acetylmuramoyl-L-alanyl-D-glutamate--2,6-diaminopimelate ligase